MDEGPGVNAEPQGKGVGGPGMHGVGERGNAAGEGGGTRGGGAANWGGAPGAGGAYQRGHGQSLRRTKQALNFN